VIDSVRILIDTVVEHDTTRLTDTLWVLQSHSWWRDTLPAAGALAAVVAAFLAAYFAYRYNKRLLKHNITYTSYQRMLAELRDLKGVFVRTRQVCVSTGMFLEALSSAALADDVDRLKFVQDARNGWKLRLDALHKAYESMFKAKQSVEEEYYAHLPVFPKLQEAVSSYCLRLLTDGMAMYTLETLLLQTQLKPESFPLDESRSQIGGAKENALVCLNNFERWYFELLDLLRQQVFAGLAQAKRRPTNRLGGDPDALHLTLDGFKTAGELGWYDPKLDTRPKKNAP
jgi:hypothetical protein